MIIGLGGKKQSGKSTIARRLSAEFRAVMRSISAPIKLMATQGLGIEVGKEEMTQYGVTHRKILQALGEGIWEYCGPILVLNVLQYPGNMVIDDVRRIGEAELIKQHGGMLIWVPGGEDGDDHVSETELCTRRDMFDVVLSDADPEMAVFAVDFWRRHVEQRRD